jgi:rhodanese-related sulfurtransferase
MKSLLNGPWSLILLTVLACVAAGVVHAQSERLPTVTPNELKDRLAAEQPPLLLDVRSEKEYLAGHVPGATNVPIDELADRLAELGAYKERGVILYCQTGRRAQTAATTLADAGFESLAMLEGHMQAWEEREFPIERGEPGSKDE